MPTLNDVRDPRQARNAVRQHPYARPTPDTMTQPDPDPSDPLAEAPPEDPREEPRENPREEPRDVPSEDK